MELSIIIVSYNIADQIGACLSSVESARCCPQEIIVVDNASTDDSVAVIVKNHPSVHLIANANNRGFAAANNQALAVCKGDFVLFLNPDTEVQPEALHRMLTHMKNNPHIGLAGPKIVNPDGSLQESISYRYPGQKHAGEELTELKGHIACVLGAAMIARQESIKKVQGFDEAFFLYGEDEDLCLRIRKAGYEIGYIDEAIILHQGGQSERQSTSTEVWRKKIKAEQLFYKKHYLPETIIKISRADLIKSYYRVFTLNIPLPFLTDKRRMDDKKQKYRIRCQEMMSLYREIRKGIIDAASPGKH